MVFWNLLYVNPNSFDFQTFHWEMSCHYDAFSFFMLLGHFSLEAFSVFFLCFTYLVFWLWYAVERCFFLCLVLFSSSWSSLCFLYLYKYIFFPFKVIFFHYLVKYLVSIFDLGFFSLNSGYNLRSWSFDSIPYSLQVPFL